jgi:hypothetical protein
MRLSWGEGVLTRLQIEWTSKTVYVLEFKHTSDQRQDYRERGECRALDQHDVLVKSLETVAKEAEGESTGWTVKLAKLIDPCPVWPKFPFAPVRITEIVLGLRVIG